MKADKIFWGILLVFIGGIFLLENFGVINFSWYYVWRFWPAILILVGVNILFSRTNSKIGLLVTVFITLAALSFVTVKGLQKKDHKASWTWNFSDDGNDDESDTDSANLEERISTYSEDFDSKYKEVTLNIKGGASKFEIKETTNNLFQADLKETTSRYFLRKTESDGIVILDFNSKSKGDRYSFDDNKYNEVKMMLNTKPVWDVNLTMGAGKVDFDFSAYKVKNIDLKGGAASFEIKLGDLYNQVNLTAETGVAKVDIAIPKNVGCQIITSTGLSSKDFEGFTKKSNGNYETSNYNVAAKKINIKLKGGLSDFKVNRY
jgi:hypothetical protein